MWLELNCGFEKTAGVVVDCTSKKIAAENRAKRTWFGVTAKVTIGPGFIHKAGFGRLVIPHPPVANWLLRLRLPEDLSRNLTFAHEFAHFQTAPLLFVYGVVLIFLANVMDQTGMGEIIFLLVNMHAAWELMSEGMVALEDTAAYRSTYKGVTRLPRLLFWAAGGLLTAAGWVVVLQ